MLHLFLELTTLRSYTVNLLLHLHYTIKFVMVTYVRAYVALNMASEAPRRLGTYPCRYGWVALSLQFTLHDLEVPRGSLHSGEYDVIGHPTRVPLIKV